MADSDKLGNGSVCTNEVPSDKLLAKLRETHGTRPDDSLDTVDLQTKRAEWSEVDGRRILRIVDIDDPPRKEETFETVVMSAEDKFPIEDWTALRGRLLAGEIVNPEDRIIEITNLARRGYTRDMPEWAEYALLDTAGEFVENRIRESGARTIQARLNAERNVRTEALYLIQRCLDRLAATRYRECDAAGEPRGLRDALAARIDETIARMAEQQSSGHVPEGAIGKSKESAAEAFGIQLPGSEGDLEVRAFLEARRQAEAAHPEMRGLRERRDAEETAMYNRFLSLDPAEAVRQEKRREELIQAARLYAGSFPAEASTSKERLEITQKTWNEYIPTHPRRPDHEAFRLTFPELHADVWNKDYLALQEDRVEAQAPGREPLGPEGLGPDEARPFAAATPTGAAENTGDLKLAKGRKRGPKPDYENSCKIAAIVGRVAPAGDWRTKLDGVRSALAQEKIATPKKWGRLTWEDQETPLVIKAIQRRLDTAKKAPPQTPA